jgi:starch phosphorylase
MTRHVTGSNEATEISRAIEQELRYALGQRKDEASPYELFRAAGLVIRRRLIDGHFETQQRFAAGDAKSVCYLSMEFLIGRSLENNIRNLGIYEACKDALAAFGWEFDFITEAEPDAALGNGGLGRLAACFLDSLATLGLPGYGYGIDYDYGLFKQEIVNGYQRERPDLWLGNESPWMIERSDQSIAVPVYGQVIERTDSNGRYTPTWTDWQTIFGVPSDLLIAGYGGQTVNYLRLFSARSSHDFDIQYFNEGDYFRAIEGKIESEKVSKILYPSDTYIAGKELRLMQEYFLVACSVRDIFRRYLERHPNLDEFANKVAIQLNDTHPALTVAELMRMLVDEYEMDWDYAWEITCAVCGYTNHTLMPEALEKWPLNLIERVLPRHLQIIFEINRRFLQQVSTRWPGDMSRLRRMSLIEEGGLKQVRMSHLAIVGSHSVNGVAKLHSELLKKDLLPDFLELWPERFNNKTNGVTHRRWILHANPRLAALITSSIGDGWVRDFAQISTLEKDAQSGDFQKEFAAAKTANKRRLANWILRSTGIAVDPASLFDVQIKRMHEYKRQLLNVMHIVHLYVQIVADGKQPVSSRTFIFAGKAAPGYEIAKLIVKLINSVADVVNNDKRVGNMLKVVFLPDYRVSLAERIIPAADLSEQISTAGTEASGTGNMKLAMNGALTIGTLDGANIEMREEVGPENIYIFGLNATQIARLRTGWAYKPAEYYAADSALKRVVDEITGNRFCLAEPGLFRPIHDRLFRDGDPYFHLADFASYVKTQEQVAHDFQQQDRWPRRAILNVARMARFSSDRTIQEYADEIWGLTRT